MTAPERSLDVTLLVHDLTDGALARAQALDAVLGELGHRARVLSTVGDAVWAPLRGTGFERRCQRLSAEQVDAAVAGDDLLVSVKTWPGSFGLGRRLSARHGIPLLVDVDDPDVESETLWLPRRRLLHRLRRDPVTLARLLLDRERARRRPTTVSNPVLQRLYGGDVVPHARADHGEGAAHTSDAPLVAFVGSVKPHKGVPLLRRAVQALAPEGWRLLVTDAPPADAHPWETWVDPASTDTRALLLACDVVVIPTLAQGMGPAQLPLKLVDALQAGRAVVVSDIGPLPWAAGPSAPTFAPGDLAGLVSALRPLRDPSLRAVLGAEARQQALTRFSPAAVAPALQRAMTAALGGRAPVGADRG